MIKNFLMISFLFLSALMSAQEVMPEPQMADSFRADGKIYVVIGVIAIIFVCLIAFLIYLEKNVSKLEKKISKTESVLTGEGTQTRH